MKCESVGKTDLLSDHFNSKQSRESVDLPPTCHRPNSLITFAFRSSEARRLLLDLEPYGGTDQLGNFPFFPQGTIDVLSPLLSVVYPLFLRLGCLFPCLLETGQFHPTDFYIPVVAKVFERLVSLRLGQYFSNLFGLLPPFQVKKFSAPPPQKNPSLPSSNIVVMRLLN